MRRANACMIVASLREYGRVEVADGLVRVRKRNWANYFIVEAELGRLEVLLQQVVSREKRQMHVTLSYTSKT